MHTIASALLPRRRRCRAHRTQNQLRGPSPGLRRCGVAVFGELHRRAAVRRRATPLVLSGGAAAGRRCDGCRCP